jgi:hypothetical protein
MPFPFPGMDPFLENRKYFPDLHGKLTTHISEALQAKLPEPYFAVINERLWVETSWRPIEPDVDILHRENDEPEESDNGGVAVAVATATATRTQPLVFRRVEEDWREAFVEIRTREPDGSERVVTTLGVLSWANKTPGEKGWDMYHKKQEEVQQGRINLVEMDLLRGGTHATLALHDLLAQRFGPFDYHVSVYKAHRSWEGTAYPWRLAEMLPEIAVPLLPQHREIALDLQTVFNRCYDAGPYRRRVRYDDLTQIEPPLRAEQTAWVQERLRTTGLLPGG